MLIGKCRPSVCFVLSGSLTGPKLNCDTYKRPSRGSELPSPTTNGSSYRARLNEPRIGWCVTTFSQLLVDGEVRPHIAVSNVRGGPRCEPGPGGSNSHDLNHSALLSRTIS